MGEQRRSVGVCARRARLSEPIDPRHACARADVVDPQLGPQARIFSMTFMGFNWAAGSVAELATCQAYSL
jgi:hypothetical protein